MLKNLANIIWKKKVWVRTFVKLASFGQKIFQIFCASVITFKKLRECVKNLVKNVSQKFGLDLSKLCFEPFLIWDLRVRKSILDDLMTDVAWICQIFRENSMTQKWGMY